jgi:hypothetical protein
MPVEARRLIRKMRGGAQAHLIEAADGNCYVVKFTNNPQHRRILVNEWIAAAFLRYLGISTPDTAVIEISPDFLASNPDVYMQLGHKRIPVEPGWHFGSKFPGDPQRVVVYDFLPDTLLAKVENLHEFRGMLAFDQWMGNADSRQAIFFRAKIREWLPDSDASPLKLGFVAHMVDHGFVFEGPNWKLADSPLHGIYFRPQVYKGITGLQDFEPWLERITHFPEDVVDQAIKQIPSSWLASPETGLADPALEPLLDQLLRRRKRVADLLEACRREKPDLFPDWPITRAHSR